MDITGTSGNDTLAGTAGADNITGLAGNDSITGGDGNDTINGGAGNDSAYGGNGDDLFIEDQVTTPADRFDGGDGIDTIELRAVPTPIVVPAGSSSQHILTSTSSLTSIERLVFASQVGDAPFALIQFSAYSTSGLSELVGGAGKDALILLITAAGSYTMPTPTLTNWAAPAANSWEATTDGLEMTTSVAAGTVITMNAASGLNSQQIFIAGSANATINGSANGDILYAGSGTSHLFGNDGNDLLTVINYSSPNGVGGFNPPTTYTGAGTTFDGGAGFDMLGIGGYVNFQGTLVGIEGVDLRPAFFPPIANTSMQDNAVLEIDSAGLAMLPVDAFFRGTGTVEVDVTNGTGFDGSHYTFDGSANVSFVINGEPGNGLTHLGTSRADYFYMGAGDQVDGGSGTDTASYDPSPAGVSFSLGNNANSGGDAAGDVLTDIENITGSHFADAVSGDFSNNLIDGGDGNDTITGGGGGSDTLLGGAGSDTLTGGDGRDVLVGGAGADVLDGGNGIDTASYATSSAAVSLNLASGVNSGGDAQGDTLAHIEQIVGSGFGDSITGDNHDLILDGGDGNDTISGGTGDDFLIGGLGDDTLYGGAGGADALTGGAGRDVFVFKAIGDSPTIAPDMIMDFVHGEDQVDLRGLGFTDIVGGTASGTHLAYNYDAASDFSSIASANGLKILLAGHLTIDNGDFIFV